MAAYAATGANTTVSTTFSWPRSSILFSVVETSHMRAVFKDGRQLKLTALICHNHSMKKLDILGHLNKLPIIYHHLMGLRIAPNRREPE